jgi:hypothetical protein
MAWNSDVDWETPMEWLLWGGAALYVLIGMAQAARNIQRGRMGSSGPLLTFIFVTLFWPVSPRA